MRLFLITLAFVVGILFANVCGLLMAMLAHNKNCSSGGNVLLIYAAIALLLMILAPFLYWRFSANGVKVARIILTIAIGIAQIVLAVIFTFGLMVILNC